MSDQASLFNNSFLDATSYKVPLADKIRPQKISDLMGYETYAKKIYINNLQSMILWGPPGSGKTSLAKILAKSSNIQYEEISGVSYGNSKLKEILDNRRSFKDNQILVIIDEIHHLNKSQQDIFLPHLESGKLIIIGTTTENPSFELRPALLSRCKVVEFNRLTKNDLMNILERAEFFSNKSLKLTQEAKEKLCEISDGDGRYLVNRVEELLEVNTKNLIDTNEMLELLPKRSTLYDKSGNEHYNLISALHKSLRGSDVDAALYWFSRMLEGGEDPLYIARRLVRFAVEDVGMADPEALHQTIDAQEAYRFLGSPEGELALAQAVVYLATAPKSNSVYVAYNQARKCAEVFGTLMPGKNILNAPTDMMKKLGYSDGYVYDHDTKNGYAGTNFFPDGLERQNFYKPVERGFEREIAKRIKWLNSRRKN